MKHQLNKALTLSPVIFTAVLANIENTCFLVGRDCFPYFEPKVETSELPSTISYFPQIVRQYSVSASGTSLSNYHFGYKI